MTEEESRVDEKKQDQRYLETATEKVAALYESNDLVRKYFDELKLLLRKETLKDAVALVGEVTGEFLVAKKIGDLFSELNPILQTEVIEKIRASNPELFSISAPAQAPAPSPAPIFEIPPPEPTVGSILPPPTIYPDPDDIE